MGLCASFYWRAHGTAARQALLWHREPAGMRVCEFLLTEAPSASPRHHTPKTGSPAPTPAWRRCSALLPPRVISALLLETSPEAQPVQPCCLG